MTDKTPEVVHLGTHSATATIDNGSFGTRSITFSTGRLARQAGSCLAQLGDTVVLSATTASKSPKEHFDFFPLTVDVEERMYAAGRIPGSFFRREGRPSEDAILTCRLIDRPLRPSFVKGLRNEVQVVETVLALDPEHPYDVVAMNAASLSTKLAGLPFSGPVGSVRVAHIEGQWVAFPTHEETSRATFDMIVAGRVTEDGDVAIMMVEAEATTNVIKLIADGSPKPDETVVASGLEAAKPAIRELCRAQAELAAVASRPSVEFPQFLDYQDDAFAAVESAISADMAQALTIGDKQERETELDRLKAVAHEKLDAQFEGREKELSAAVRSLTKKLVRQRVLRDEIRIDGRGPRDIRPLSAEVGVLPRVHGSALFERGETQILGVTTLNMLRLEQSLDTLSPEKSKRYMHNYNFPPYSTGETGRVGSPKRREIGHGALAERALLPVLPTREEFPYAIRQVSEALGSNGSTSMGSVCASSLSLLFSGVPLKAPVGGIAMGLISDEVDGKTRYVTLTDILGAEDAFGDMDFKVAGTRDFVTALQLDTKLTGIPSDVLAGALSQAHDARHAILDVMQDAIETTGELSEFAPRVVSVKIPTDKIGAVIGPKGQMINSITEETGAEITIEDDGTIYVGATNGPSAEAAIAKINAIANPTMPKVGDRFLGTVVKTAAFGAFISLTPGRDGLLHISKVGDGKRVERVEDFLNVGDKVEVQIADIDNRGKVYLDKVGADGEVIVVPGAGGAPRAEGEGGERRERAPRTGDREGGERRERRQRRD
ncbi:polyribonucleotide nucleotidyltransferase [Longispora fulva]|uniref:Polyribonucleotide nucleotidyltransferase n=1 Tax=Longispora fulva TaxID=619741 RepID=A0A8J7GK59_9ACTN|nr:polyribonucleotide nucleotidyltransferase [Longispora fulva]MBG6138128.1 polyribonucleotide nucleotidyltransferase [Longispora fulva]GIG60381.1 polyribonucleotide nucleotidyltransferase [Longispora fulva]